MFIYQLISSEIPSLTMEDTGDKALQLMQDHQISNITIVEGDEYKALIKEEDLLNWETPEKALSSADFTNFKPVVYGNQHPYEAIRRALQQNISIVPVLNEDNKYMGSVSRNALFEFICNNSGLDKSGGILCLEAKPANYSLSEIARICESNDVIITNLQVFTYPNQELMEIVIKTNTKDIQSLVASFERYEYEVKEVFGEMPAMESMIDRYQSLMHYINM
ncbi:CBS domain-containing protein [Taibaiella lutea]|uniref:CBS domain-containing protein n=1 Tax=Taibaiella lutea TaxID=2608001 RepID=A0A5M6CBT7_9BACT|nr:CBS domain-containing protein [Taibaiella lutea]KAA5532587.1 CBS domain-containing protein [Taibaiella lutea]